MYYRRTQLWHTALNCYEQLVTEFIVVCASLPVFLASSLRGFLCCWLLLL